jgi:hypothetical protein
MAARLKGSVLSKGGVWALLLASVGISAAFGQDIGWGPTVSGLRVGVAIGSTELSVVFENVAVVRQDLLMEQQPGGYAFSIRAVEGPHGEQFPVRSAVDPGGLGRLVPIGLVIPIVVSIPPGRMYEVKMPLKILLAIAPGDAGLESLLQQGYGPVR